MNSESGAVRQSRPHGAGEDPRERGRVSRLRNAFVAVRQGSLDNARPLHVEDYGLQAAPFASPPKWHLAHTSWFFETFILKPFAGDYQTPDPIYEHLFNSYYNGIGEQHPRARRGLLSRPTLDEVQAYRAHVDSAMLRLLDGGDHPDLAQVLARCELGIEHERQHQELFFTDIKYSLAANPVFPAYQTGNAVAPLKAALHISPSAPVWHEFEGGLVEHGYEHTHRNIHENRDDEGEYGAPEFCFDNELPRHPVYLQPFALANRLVSNAEYQLFIDAGGYRRPELWLADGWALVEQERWGAPLYWIEQGDESLEYTLHGLQPRRAAAPVCHVSGYEADAYARWAGARLPTEFEWERVASLQAGNSLSGAAQHGPRTLHPQPAHGAAMQQLYGACWQWTQSAYSPYPGFSPSAGAIGEYNGKFMSNQWVLRGGSCVTAASQSRTTYRNFFYPQDRWQFSGIRLAR